jgi:hypothetical protein
LCWNTEGKNSVFSSITAVGGGGGGAYTTYAKNGGSGGGGGWSGDDFVGDGIEGQGHDGGSYRIVLSDVSRFLLEMLEYPYCRHRNWAPAATPSLMVVP